MKIPLETWEAIVAAVDFMAGGDEVCADIWPKLASLKPGDSIEITEGEA